VLNKDVVDWSTVGGGYDGLSMADPGAVLSTFQLHEVSRKLLVSGQFQFGDVDLA
jgi:hypothetical protein